MLENGYIKAFRALKRWGWYKDSPTKDTWLHILLSANYEPQTFKGREIERGQLVTSYPSLAEETGLSIQNVRTAIKHLKQTGEITMKSYRDYSIITVPKFDEYQSDQQPTNIQLTAKQQADNSQLTGCSQSSNRQLTTMEESKKARKQESKKVRNNTPIPPYEEFGFSEAMRLRLDEWLCYKSERREAYKPTGLHSLLKTVEREIARLGEPAVLNRITDAMASGWRGMNLDKMEGKCGTAANTRFEGLGERI